MLGRSDTITAKVASASRSGPVPSGDVTIFEDGISKGTYPLQSDGEVTETYSVLPPTPNTMFTASYTGDANYLPSTSAAISQTYIPASSALPAILGGIVPTAGISGSSFKARVPVRIENSGPFLKGKFTFGLYLDEASVGLDGNQVALKSVVKRMTLQQGKSITVPFAVSSLPATLAAGIYHFVAQITGPAGDSNIATSPQTVTVSEPFAALAAAAGPIAPAILKPGGTGYLVISITNTGNAPARGALDITVMATNANESVSETPLARAIHPAKLASTSTGRYRV